MDDTSQSSFCLYKYQSIYQTVQMCCEMMNIVLITVHTSVLLFKAIQWALVAWFRPQAALFDIPALNHKFLHIVNFSLFLPLHLFIRELHTLHKSI